jgi:hypothetical protein
MLAPTETPARRALVLMPFDQSFDDAYQLGIREACQSAGWDCSRVDEQVFSGLIIERIYAEIISADLIIADMTGRNLNVFYEVGYAHALKKRVVLLTRAAEDIPFDLSGHRHIVYAGRIATLRSELSKELVSILAENSASPEIFRRLSEIRVVGLKRRYSKEKEEFSITYQDMFLMISYLISTNDRRRSIMNRLPTYIATAKGESPIRYRTIKSYTQMDFEFFGEEEYDSILAKLNAWELIAFGSTLVSGDGRQVTVPVVKLTDFGQKQFGLLMPAST